MSKSAGTVAGTAEVGGRPPLASREISTKRGQSDNLTDLYLQVPSAPDSCRRPLRTWSEGSYAWDHGGAALAWDHGGAALAWDHGGAALAWELSGSPTPPVHRYPPRVPV
ncbi:hypothetical protein BC938DRAFT_480250 [Jimgerdemannia flammicorona]|uniref:Uncharacterized protein n=1 Tax=Jimgerdemannia flammicorona TaxID=994334 RepID=A0A433QIX7_9FUNG|nr:hypothetical protein BC938DRAFT_480250 [Jimgerdemannia flammicorona]